jgi:phospholipid-binding lipoprotein MlaA
MTSAKLSILLFCSLLFFGEQSFANNTNPQFNFDDNYGGEEISHESHQTIYDPFEVVNRKVFAFNELLDKKVSLPVIRQYRKHIPERVRTSVTNLVNNLSAPFSVVNSLIQGDGQNAMASFSSFLINSTVGVVGLFDVAGDKKIKYNEEDFGQSLGKYCSKAGPYLVIPFLGPSNVRDFSGFVAEKIISPLAFNSFEVGNKRDLIGEELAISLSLVNGISIRDSLIEVVDDIRKNSFDPYSTMRSAYLQRRESLILNK